ncbi:MAG: beta-lactamase family protein [Saprospiraceae bacterium]|nr:beta-lactamase family protein [Saprospiraceae bacterium]
MRKNSLPILILSLGALLTYLFWPEPSLEEQMQNRHVPAVGIGVIEEGKVIRSEVIGELEAGVVAAPNAIFNVASLTKPVFAMLVLKLVELWEWDLDAPIHPHWIDHEIKEDVRHELLTTRILLSHQSGFPNWRWNHPSGKLAFEFDPGTRYQYSGEGFEYLKNAIQHKMGKPLQSLADSLLFSPLGLSHTSLVWGADMEQRPFAKWHDKSGGVYDTYKRKEGLAADDLLTTIGDYCTFSLDVINGAGLSPALYEDMISPQVKVNRKVDYGLGWLVVKDLPNAEYALVHSGADQGVRTMVVLLPKSKSGVVVFTNGDKGNKIVRRLMRENCPYGREILGAL